VRDAANLFSSGADARASAEGERHLPAGRER
jgi:hypothetical protein